MGSELALNTRQSYIKTKIEDIISEVTRLIDVEDSNRLQIGFRLQHLTRDWLDVYRILVSRRI